MKNISTLMMTFLSLSSLFAGQWEKLDFPGITPYTLLMTSQGLLAANNHVIYRSTDNGISWDSLSTISSLGISKMAQIGNVLLSTTSRIIIWPALIPSVFRSDNFGQSWYPVLDGVYGGSSIAFSNSKTYVDLDGDVYCSADTGRTWTRANTDSTFPDYVAEIIGDGNTLYARIQAEALYRSNDNAISWDSLSMNFPRHFYNVLLQSTNIYVGTYSNGFYVSNDSGLTWHNSSVGLPDSAGIRTLHMYQNCIIASISKDFQQSIYRFQLDENVWHPFSEGFSLQRADWIFDFDNNNEHIFLATDNAIWRRPLSDLLTNVAQYKARFVPDAFLFQNSPNPFNSFTTIRFTVNKTGFTELKIFDQIGRIVTTLYKGSINPGTYWFRWNAGNVSSGIYFAHLVSGSYSSTCKMLLQK